MWRTACRELKDLIDAFNAISDKFAEPMSDTEMTDLLEQQGELQLKIDAADGWDLETQSSTSPPTRCACPHLMPTSQPCLGGEKRRVALVPPAAVQSRHAAAGRTHEPPGCGKRGLARALIYRTFPGTVVAITHDRYFLDNAAGWILELDRGYGIPFEGNYSAWLEDKDRRLEMEEKARRARDRKPSKPNWSGSGLNPRLGMPKIGPAWLALKSLTARNFSAAARPWNCTFHQDLDWAMSSWRSKASARGLAINC